MLQSDATYQWIDCATGLAIENETGQSFSPTENGTYAVEITNGNCVSVSTCTEFIAVGVSEYAIDHNLYLQPNPTSGELTVNYTNGQIISFEILDLAGKLIRKTENVNASNTLIDMRKLNAGVYLLRVETEDGIISKRVIKN